MYLHFQEKPRDLCAAVACWTIMTVARLALGIGSTLAIILVLFLHGYMLVAVLFSDWIIEKTRENSWVEWVTLSIGLSIALVPLMDLLLNFTPWRIGFVPLAVFTMSVACAAYQRRIRLPASVEYS